MCLLLDLLPQLLQLPELIHLGSGHGLFVPDQHLVAVSCVLYGKLDVDARRLDVGYRLRQSSLTYNRIWVTFN